MTFGVGLVVTIARSRSISMICTLRSTFKILSSWNWVNKGC